MMLNVVSGSWPRIERPRRRSAAGVDVMEAKELDDRGSPGLDQLALATLIESGRYDRHLRHMRAVFAGKRRALIDALARHAPDVELRGLAAGFHAVARLPEGLDERAVAAPPVSAQSVCIRSVTCAPAAAMTRPTSCSGSETSARRRSDGASPRSPICLPRRESVNHHGVQDGGPQLQRLLSDWSYRQGDRRPIQQSADQTHPLERAQQRNDA
jgi:hypothetical protein